MANRYRFNRASRAGKHLFIAILSCGIMILTAASWADDKPSSGQGDLAKASQNPISSLISVPFEFNNTFNNGPEDAYALNLNIKPVIPMSITKKWNLVNRLTIPVIYQSEKFTGQGLIGPIQTTFKTEVVSPGQTNTGSEFGFGDITYQGFFIQKKSGKYIWGIGPQVGFPTGMGRLTTNHFSAGPAAVALTMPGHWVIGLVASNAWSVGEGYNNPPDVNSFSAQYFINLNFKGGWYLATAPLITANWEAENSDDIWTVPFGFGGGRVFKIGKQPVNLKLVGYYSAIRPDEASDWNLQFTWNILFPPKPNK